MPGDATELAAELGRAASGTVRTEDVRWEPSGGLLSDLVVGRFVLFLTSEIELLRNPMPLQTRILVAKK